MIDQEVIHFGENVKVFRDKKTKVSTVAVPIVFPTGYHGILSLTRLSPVDWLPSGDIESITINYKRHENKSAEKPSAA